MVLVLFFQPLSCCRAAVHRQLNSCSSCLSNGTVSALWKHITHNYPHHSHHAISHIPLHVLLGLHHTHTPAARQNWGSQLAISYRIRLMSLPPCVYFSSMLSRKCNLFTSGKWWKVNILVRPPQPDQSFLNFWLHKWAAWADETLTLRDKNLNYFHSVQST